MTKEEMLRTFAKIAREVGESEKLSGLCGGTDDHSFARVSSGEAWIEAARLADEQADAIQTIKVKHVLGLIESIDEVKTEVGNLTFINKAVLLDGLNTIIKEIS